MTRSDNVLSRLHKMIDAKFGRQKRDTKVDSIRLKHSLTLFAISKEFIKEDPETIVTVLKQLVRQGRVITNIEQENVNPFDAYFIPKTEL